MVARWIPFVLFRNIEFNTNYQPGITLRWCVDDVLKKRESIEDLMRNNFDIAMPEASEEIKRHYVTIDEA